ncbi:MAG: MCE family protein [Deltaproteobacteria bacterium]|nr:MCE family protein [Deltaproteobacteria bacterium]
MRLKFNRVERIAGLFVLLAIAGTVLSTLSILAKKGWFEPKVTFFTHLENAAAIRVGTPVLMAGIKVGSIEKIELQKGGEVEIEFVVFKSYLDWIRRDSRVRLIRPTFLGEKIFDISVGSGDQAALAPMSNLPSEGQADIVDAMSAKKVGQLVENLEKFSTEALNILQQMGSQGNVKRLVENLRVTSDDLRRTLPNFISKGPKMGEDFSTVMANFAVLTRELAKLAPGVSESAQSLPQGTKKLVELLNETVTLVRGMQRSFLFRGGVNDVREEELGKERLPAGK